MFLGVFNLSSQPIVLSDRKEFNLNTIVKCWLIILSDVNIISEWLERAVFNENVKGESTTLGIK